MELDRPARGALDQTLHEVHEVSQVSAARREIVERARQVGLPEAQRNDLALAVTEAATNLVKHAQEGFLLARPLQDGDAIGVEVLAVDRGPGIPDARNSMVDGVSTSQTMGTGLGAIRRASQEFQLYAAPKRGTALRFVVWTRLPARPLQIGAVCIALRGEPVCGDAWTVECDGHALTAMVADGLGHGPDAAVAAQAAVRVMRRDAGQAPDTLLNAMHAALRPTRGAAIAIAHIKQDGVLHYAGIGNISGSIRRAEFSKQLISHNGIVGHQMRKLQEVAVPWPPDALLIMHSDGIDTRWKLDAYPGIEAQHPALIAAVLYRDHQRARDDATVLVVRHNVAEVQQ